VQCSKDRDYWPTLEVTVSFLVINLVLIIFSSLVLTNVSNKTVFLVFIHAKYEQPKIFGSGSLEAEKYRRIFYNIKLYFDRLCGLVVRVLGYRFRGPGSIPGTTRKKSSGSGTGSTQKTVNTAVGICYADHVAPSISIKLAITSPTSGGRSVGIVRWRTETMDFSLLNDILWDLILFYQYILLIHA
jgi:hypothetical protein